MAEAAETVETSESLDSLRERLTRVEEERARLKAQLEARKEELNLAITTAEDNAASSAGVQRLAQILKCAHRFSYELVGYVGTKNIGSLLVVMARCETTLQTDVEEDLLIRDVNKWESKGIIQILDFLPMPKRYVRCSPLSSTHGDWTDCIDPGFQRFMENSEEETRSMIIDLMLEKIRINEDREPTPAERADIQAHAARGMREMAQERNFCAAAGLENAHHANLLHMVGGEGFVHSIMNANNNSSINPGVGANETVVLFSSAQCAGLQNVPKGSPRRTDVRRVVFAVTASHEVVSYGGFHADWSYVRKLFSVHAFLGGGREPICMLAYSFPFQPGPGQWHIQGEDFEGPNWKDIGEKVDRDGWGAHDGVRIDVHGVRAIEDALDLDPESDDIGVVLRTVILIANARANAMGQWNALEAFHATGGDRTMLAVGHYPDGTSTDRIPFGVKKIKDVRLIHMCGGQAVADYPFIEGNIDTDVRTSPIGLLDATKRVLAERLADDATLDSFTALARALTGFRAAVEALLPKERRGRAGYAEDNLKGMTIAQATEINEDALRFYGIPPGTWNTSAEYRDMVRYRSDSDESDY